MTEFALDDERWRGFVDAAPGAWPYHHPAWTNVLTETYGYRGWGLGVTSGESLVAGLPVMEVRSLRGRRRHIALPFTDYCSPLAFDHEALEELAAQVRERRLGDPDVEAQLHATLPGASGHEHAEHVMHVLELDDDLDKVFAGFHSSHVRRAIRKAERSGDLHIRRASRQEDVATHYYRLHLGTRRRQGTPVQPRRFFKFLWERMLEPGLGFALLAYRGETAIAGAVFLEWKGVLTYKYGASDQAFLRMRPNHLLFWRAIQDAHARGARTFDLGRTAVDNEGLRAFKGHWGASELPLTYTTFAEAPPSLGSSRAQRIGERVIQRAPPLVCRGVGELLYRYAA